MTVVALRADNAYWGIAKQTSQGTPVAPTNFWRWEDGTKIELDAKTEEVREGDTTRRLSLMVQNMQSVKLSYTGTLRPIDAGFAECATMGAGSDALTAPAANTTFAATVAAGSTTISLASNTGLTSGGTAVLALDAGTPNYETVTVTVPGTGAGPYVYTLTNSATTKFTHTITTSTAQTPATHTLTDQSDGNFYTIEVSLGGTSGIILRVRDCKVDTCQVSASAGSLIRYNIEFLGIAAAIQVSAATLTWDPRQPFLFQQGTYTLDGVTTGDATAVEEFSIERKNNVELVQTEQLVAASSIFTKLDLTVSIKISFLSGSTRIQSVYFGGPAGTAPAQALLLGALLLLFTAADAFHTLQYNVPTIAYTKASLPEPKSDGKHFVIDLEATATSNMSANTFLMQTVVLNTQTTAYG